MRASVVFIYTEEETNLKIQDHKETLVIKSST